MKWLNLFASADGSIFTGSGCSRDLLSSYLATHLVSDDNIAISYDLRQLDAFLKCLWQRLRVGERRKPNVFFVLL